MMMMMMMMSGTYIHETIAAAAAVAARERCTVQYSTAQYQINSPLCQAMNDVCTYITWYDITLFNPLPTYLPSGPYLTQIPPFFSFLGDKSKIEIEIESSCC